MRLRRHPVTKGRSHGESRLGIREQKQSRKWEKVAIREQKTEPKSRKHASINRPARRTASEWENAEQDARNAKKGLLRSTNLVRGRLPDERRLDQCYRRNSTRRVI